MVVYIIGKNTKRLHQCDRFFIFNLETRILERVHLFEIKYQTITFDQKCRKHTCNAT